jgi:hypothetical protein
MMSSISENHPCHTCKEWTSDGSCKVSCYKIHNIEDDFIEKMYQYIHDIKNTMTVIKGYSELLRMEELSEAEKDFVDKIWRANMAAVKHANDAIEEIKKRKQ